MFNYFLVVTGIVATAYVSLLKEGYSLLATIVGMFGFFTSLGFICLDCRNGELVHLSERILEKIEGETLFVDMKTRQGNDEVRLGILYKELLEDTEQRARYDEMVKASQGGELSEEGRRLKWLLWRRATVFRHTFWFRKIEIFIAVIFILLSIRALAAVAEVIPVRSEATELQRKVDSLTGDVKDMKTANQALLQKMDDLNIQIKQGIADRTMLQKQMDTIQLLVKAMPPHRRQ